MATLDHLSGEVTVAADIPARIDQAFASIKTACFASFTVDLIGVLAKMANATPADIEANLPAADVALIKNEHLVDGLTALVIDRRAKLRAAELAQRTGKPCRSATSRRNETPTTRASPCCAPRPSTRPTRSARSS